MLTRPAVEAGEKLGFLPGDLAEKVNPYLRPLYDALHDMVDFDRARKLHRARHDRGRAARLHARPDAERLLRHPRRGAEHHERADEDVPHAPRLRLEGGDHRRRDADRSAGRQGVRAEARRATSCATSRASASCSFTERDVVRHPLVQEIITRLRARRERRRGAQRSDVSVTAARGSRAGHAALLRRLRARDACAHARRRTARAVAGAGRRRRRCARSTATTAARIVRPTCSRSRSARASRTRSRRHGLLGDVVISVDTAARQAAERGARARRAS